MSTVPATNKEFRVARHTDLNITITSSISNREICGKKKSPMGRKCHVYKLVP